MNESWDNDIRIILFIIMNKNSVLVIIAKKLNNKLEKMLQNMYLVRL